ncbi:uncharacterized protein N7473_000810 [Penicillium subrubescens]|uniref:uncharacterized protein n=1 Tax=Penicillium subrubescens TaxID=1316194 RepID=UPI0025457F93|nr:uncharacterized protein N7473_000810 [Penicillium subrubescens]KAJ5911507.1 hypothetical protein N7473_000810 [Penicillium subrubescens]
MLASIFHANGILRELYGIQRKPLDVQVEIARKYGADLIQWRRDIGAFIDTPNIELLQVTYQRQYTVLNFAFAHAQILLYRPFVLRNLASVGKGTVQDSSHLRTLSEENIKKCLQAATRILEIFQILCRTRRMYKSFFFTHYYVFSAIVVLYVSVIQNWMNLDFEPIHNLRIGEEAQRELAKCGTQASFPQRYVVVLEELRQEAKRIMNQTRGRQDPSIVTLKVHEQLSEPSFTPSSEPFNQVGATFTAPLYHSSTGGWANEAVEDTTPDSHFADVTGWGDFDSLVLTGLGELGHFFSDNHLGA